MTLALVALVGVLASGGLWLLARPAFAAPVLQRTNYRGAPVPVAAGVVLAVAVIATEALLVISESLGRDPAAGEQVGRTAVLIATLGFGLLGAFDDLAAHGDDRGFKGHLSSLLKGRLTTGGLKLAGGGLLAIVVVHTTGEDHFGRLALGAGVVALGANLGNLFDRAPGRTTKVALLAGAAVVAAAAAADRPLLVGMVAVLGAGMGLLVPDLRESLMLGDAGANVLGAAVATGVVATTGVAVQLAVLAALVVLNLSSEVVSFSRAIDKIAPLRALDRLGRRRSD